MKAVPSSPIVVMIAAACFVVTVLSTLGCSIQRAKVASRAQAELIGMSKKDLLLCAGVPQREAQVDDLEFLTFVEGGDNINSAVATRTATNTLVVAGKSAHRYCEATFALKDGIVQKVNYQGRTGGLLTKGEQCAFIVEGCVK